LLHIIPLFLKFPCLPRLAQPSQATPNPAMPNFSYACLACLAPPGHALPCHAYPATPIQAKIGWNSLLAKS